MRIVDWRGWLKACVAQEVEQRRLFPWLAVGFGCGVLLYFAAEGRPALWAPLAGLAVAAVAAVLLRARPVGFTVALGFCAVFAGFAAGVLRERRVEAPVLGRMTIGAVSGFVETLEERVKGGRLVLRPVEIAGLPAVAGPCASGSRYATCKASSPATSSRERSPAAVARSRPPGGL